MIDDKMTVELITVIKRITDKMTAEKMTAHKMTVMNVV